MRQQKSRCDARYVSSMSCLLWFARLAARLAGSERFSHGSHDRADAQLLSGRFPAPMRRIRPQSRLLRAQRSGGGTLLRGGVFQPCPRSATHHPAQRRPRPAGLEQCGLRIRRAWRLSARDRSHRTANMGTLGLWEPSCFDHLIFKDLRQISVPIKVCCATPQAWPGADPAPP